MTEVMSTQSSPSWESNISQLNRHGLCMPLLQCSWGSDSHVLQGLREDPVNLFLIIPDAVQPADLFPQLLYLVTWTLASAHVLQMRSPSSLALRSVRGTRCPCCTGPTELHLPSGAASELGLRCAGVVAPVGAEDCACGTSTQLLRMCTLSSAKFLACCCVPFCC